MIFLVLLVFKLHFLQVTLVCIYLTDIKTLQQTELDKVDTWMRSNRLSINCNKTAYMILIATCSQKCNYEISMSGVRIQQTDSFKYLGVIIDNKLSWKQQISSLCGKLSQACGVVCKI